MGKKSKRQAGGASVQRPQAGVVMNNRAVCRAVNELWESKSSAFQKWKKKLLCVYMHIASVDPTCLSDLIKGA